LHGRDEHAQRAQPVQGDGEVGQARRRDGRGGGHRGRAGDRLGDHAGVRRLAGAFARRRGQDDHQVHRGAHRQAVRGKTMRSCQASAAVVVVLAASLTLAAEGKPLTPAEARKKVGETVTVEMTVRAAKDRLAKRGEIYLDSEGDFKDEKNFAVVITRAGAGALKAAGVDSPAEHFQGKKVRASGTVKEVDKVPRIEVNKAGQIRLAGEKPPLRGSRPR